MFMFSDFLDQALSWYVIIKFLHIMGAAVLLGTGAGIAFFMMMAHNSKIPFLIAHTGRIVVIADTIFTATAVVLQPITGYILARITGWDVTEGWIVTSLGLYVLTGLFWLPVVWIQIQLRNIALECVKTQNPLPDRYFKLYNIWFACGFPAFLSILTIIILMITKPSFDFL